MAAQFTLMKGPLARDRAVVDFVCDELLARAGFAGDQHRDIGTRDALDLAEDLLHRRRRAKDLAEANTLDAVLQRLIVELQFIDQKRVANDQRRLGREDGQNLQGGLIEELGDVVIAHVDEPDEISTLEQGHAHDRGQAQVHDRQGILEAGIVERVRDDQRLAAFDHALDDGVGQVTDGIRDGLASQVARHLDHGFAGFEQDDEALVRVADLDDDIEEGVEQARDLVAVHELLRELEKRL